MQRIKNKGHWIGIVLFLLIGIALLFFQAKPEKEYIAYQEFLSLAEAGKINVVTIENSPTITFTLKDNPEDLFETDNPRAENFKEALLLQGIQVTEDTSVNMVGVAQSLFGIGVFAGVIFWAYKNKGKQGVESKKFQQTAEPMTKITFDHVLGNEEAKESVKDLIDFIQNTEKYARYGARMPRGILFYGPPGTGKTLMAKAIAGEAAVPFYSVAGSDFVQMYVGVGAMRVRELFEKARKSEKAVIFIDEIDALGKKRSNALVGGSDERDQTLNALLAEMSGFSENEGIIVIAATNRLDVLDEALLRPGRFDRQIEIGLPDVKAREKILSHYAGNKPIGDCVNLARLAKDTVYFSGAMLENLLNESAILAAKEGDRYISHTHLDTAYYAVLAGSEKKDRSVISYDEKKITAYHEAGHALVTKLQAKEHIISKITIIPSTKGAGGFCVSIPPDRMFMTKKQIEVQIMISLGGRAAEEVIFGKENVTTGASNDIEKATLLLKDYIGKYGMGEMGLLNHQVLFEGDSQNTVLPAYKAMMDALYAQVKEVLTENRPVLVRLAETLLEKETLKEEDLAIVFS